MFEDLPANTHVKYDLSFSQNIPLYAIPDDVVQRRQLLFSIGTYTYVLMPEGYDTARFGEVSRAFFERNIGAGRPDQRKVARLAPAARRHPPVLGPAGAIGPPATVTICTPSSRSAAFTLLVACINYMNLATARAAKRGQRSRNAKISARAGPR